jgi:competence protein ComEA
VVGVLAAVGFVVLRPSPAEAPEVSLPYAEGAAPVPSGGEAPSDGEAPTTTDVTTVVVHAAGAVNAPGIYQVPSDARLADVVAAAGGATVDADLDRVNLAAAVEDGQQVYVPRVGEAASSIPPPGGGSSGSSEPVNVNTADAGLLESLPGVGPATAQAIIAYRDEHGAFATVDELLDVPGIGDAKLAQLRDLVTV